MRLSTIPILLLALLFVGSSSTAHAQEILNDPNWIIGVDDADWLNAADHLTRGAAYNAASGNVVVATRVGGVRVLTVDGETGDFVADLDVTGIAGGTFAINVVGTTDDGQIFATNLVTHAGNSPLKIYRWADESAAPTLVYEGAPDTLRFGDSFAVYGSADSAYVFVSGSSNTSIAEFRWNGDTLSTPTMIPVAPGAARGGIAVGPGGESLWINGSGSAVQEIDRETGAVIRSIPTEDVAGGFHVSAFATIDGRDYVVAAITSTEARAHIIDVTDPGSESVVASTMLLGENANPNATGAVDFDIAGNQLFVLGTNNGLAAFSTEFLIGMEPPEVEPLATIRGYDLGTEVSFEAVVGRSRGAFTYAQDTTAGITLRQTSGAFTDSVAAGAIRPGTRIRATGVLSEFRQLLQINQGDLSAFEILGQGPAPEPTVVTLAELAANGEDYEGMVVRVDGLETSSAHETFAAASSYAVSDPTTPEGTIVLRIPNASDTDVDGLPVPDGTFSFRGVVGQFDTADPAAGYQLLAIDESDVFVPPALLDNPEWMIAAGDVPWFANDNATRGGDYNPATDRLLVVSRSGGAAVHVLHPANGLKIGELDMTGVAGGTFPINEISVTEDGQIYAANLVVAAGAEVRIYRWADEDAEPQVVFAGTLEGPRFGDVLRIGGSGNDVRVYISGSGNPDIAMLQITDGEVVGDPTYIPVGGQRARMGIFEVPGQDSLWINSPGSALAKIGLDGEGREIPNEQLSTDYGDIYFFEWDGRYYVLTGPLYSSDHRFALLDVTDPGEERIAYETMALGENANANGVGFATADWKRGNIIVGATNNAIAAFSLEQHPNTAPAASDIITPEDAAEIRIEGDPATEFSATWEEATDPENDTVLYRWQLSAGSDFSATVIDTLVGTATSITTTYGAVAAILDAANVGFDQSITLYHRVVTSDGDLETEGSAKTVVLVRGTLTNIDSGLDLPTEFALKGNYPNPFNPSTNIRFDLPEAADVRIEVYDILGRRVMLMENAMQAGANQNILVDASALASGTYLYRVVAEMASRTRVETGKMVLVK